MSQKDLDTKKFGCSTLELAIGTYDIRQRPEDQLLYFYGGDGYEGGGVKLRPETIPDIIAWLAEMQDKYLDRIVDQTAAQDKCLMRCHCILKPPFQCTCGG